MRIRIYGENKNFPKEEQRDLVAWLGRCLLKDRADDFLVTVINKPSLPDLPGMDVYGEHIGFWRNGRAVYARITINTKYPKASQRYTHAHEMTHVKQECLGETNFQQTLWRKRPVDKDLADNDTPWEIEANRRERSLVRAYLSAKKKIDHDGSK